MCGGGGDRLKYLLAVKKKGKKGTAPSLNVVMSMTTKGMNLPGSFFFIFEKFFFWLCSYKSFLLKGQNFSRKNTGFRLMKKSNLQVFFLGGGGMTPSSPLDPPLLGGIYIYIYFDAIS